MNNSGKFVISLDFELLWGMRDKLSIEEYGNNILGVWDVMPRLLELFKEFEVGATFATVGFLFASNKEEIARYTPEIKPNYKDKNLSPYNGHFDSVKETEADDKYHFGSQLIELLKKYPDNEIATHTFSHYYCNAEGQTINEFNEDMRAAVAIASDKGVTLDSLIFPRNMFNQEYIKVCQENGIKCYRGNEDLWFQRRKTTSKLVKKGRRALRLINAYLNVSGHHCYKVETLAKTYPYNVPSSRFLRPYASSLKIFDGLRKQRICKSMTYAAKHNLMYHLWWHPHNFGSHLDENLNFLRTILEHYKALHETYGFSSITMGSLADQMDKKIYG